MKCFICVGFLLTITSLFSYNWDSLAKKDFGWIIIIQSNKINGNDFIDNKWNNGMLVMNDSIFSMQDYLWF